MTTVPDKIQTWQMVTPFKKDRETGEVTPGKLEKTEIDVPELQAGEVLVKVAGCGVCHTDLGYFYFGVPTVNKPPLTLGHEISGTVVAAADDVKSWTGKEVIIPAVMPCRKCYLCKTGRGNRCLAQKMPGNSMGIYGGNSSHIPVPAIDLCEVTNRGDIPLEKLAVVADAATTPFQAAKRADVQVGDNTIVIGVGGVGQYMVQILKALGAANVVAIDINQERLDNMLKNGADFVVNSMGKTSKEIAGEIKAFRKENSLPSTGWKIFEVSGTKPGQELGLALLSFVGKMVIVGFGPQKVEYSISRLMAFDAELIGSWGCLPEYYPSVLSMVTSGKINFEEFVQTRPMSTIQETYAEAHKQSPDKRIVLVPDF
ncbi:6-hydroxycyclohex-1-ene-1-carbonyl-CoA dehydrogenase [Desulfobacula phenolica]|uniref:6-hydroxycyclohex-1-ene-1-carbonyl-CoA dehydrogenase n=1 Tax=Desulfobacula phenolica TaxID=90732 RepID=A0A1H2E4Q3_9BACT|nr:6-hydroxycyclohex-1-ene-1-carbonyl-CoA dehydrogenase [Desulfobacula phenolica]SDT90023.1 6-hydroxycyclohex-1-ene-1-carbonyl-CoA dehydrogenase [Desulfobacula phenolica]